MDTKHPGAVLYDEFLYPLGLPVRYAAKELEIAYTTLNDLVRCRKGISPQMALRLERFLGEPAEYWMTLHNQYFLEQAARRSDIQQALKTIVPLGEAT